MRRWVPWRSWGFHRISNTCGNTNTRERTQSRKILQIVSAWDFFQWLYFEWRQRNTLGHLLTTKYISESCMAPKGNQDFVIQNVLILQSSKNWQWYFKEFYFPSKKRKEKKPSNRSLCKAGHMDCSSPKGECRNWLTLWLETKTMQPGVSFKSDKPGFCCFIGTCVCGPNGVLVFSLLKMEP